MLTEKQMLATKRTRKVVVLGMGNLLLKDEGIGVHVAQVMQEMPSPDGIEMEVVDGGTLPDIVPLDGVDKLIVVDAVKGGGEPGTIYRFHPEDIRTEYGIATSLHQVSLLENLWMMERFGHKPEEAVIVGVEPADISSGLELSAGIQERVSQIIDIVMNEVQAGLPDKPEKGEGSK
ncbi:hydrogenase maturation protease [Chloroflexota bacterium]